MKMTKIYCVILCISLISSVFSGCNSSEKKDKTSFKKQTATSAQAVSSETSTAESSMNLEDNSSLNNSQTDPINSSIGSGLAGSSSSRSGNNNGLHPLDGSTGIKLYPEEAYAPARAPYKHEDTLIQSVEEAQKFVRETDPLEYKDGYYFSFIKAVKEAGHIIEPYYKDKSVFAMTKENGQKGYSFDFEKRFEGLGYACAILYEDQSKAVADIFYIPKEQQELFSESPYLFTSGKNVRQGKVITEEEFLEDTTFKKTEMLIQGESKKVYYKTSGKDVDRIWTLCYPYDNEYLIKLYILDESKIEAFELAQNLSFKKIPLEE